MPTTANFSLEYPDDNSSVDIAGHFETLADDVDAAINTRLALTGGTLTGALVGTLTTDSSSSTTGAFKTAGGMGIAKALYVGTTLNVTGATTLTGDLTVSKAAPYLTVNSTSGHAYSLMSRPAGSRAWQYFQTAGSTRWTTGVSADAESGANAGSNYTIAAWDDAGSALSTPLTITRSTGATTLTGDLTISKADPLLKLSASSGTPILLIDAPASGTAGQMQLRTGTSKRWMIQKNNTAESGSNAGSNFELYSYTDAGAYLSTPLTITRSTGAMTLTGSLSGTSLSLSSTLSVTGNTTLTGNVISNVTIEKASPTLMVSASSGESRLDISGTSASNRALRFRTAGVARWTMFGADGTAESGANAGSNFILASYDDAGSYISSPLTITRSTGAVTLTGDLTISKASAVQTLSSSSGAVTSNIDRVAGQNGLLRFRTGTSSRWVLRTDNSAESSTAFGSDFSIDSYNNSGVYIESPVFISRSSGIVTVGNASTAGLSLGYSGPRMMRGTGSPEGVVTAPIGSIWFQTDSTVGVTHWRKATGTGNTGWVVMEGDTGLRDLTAVGYLNSWTHSGSNINHIRRIGNVVYFDAWLLSTSATNEPAFTIPSGFRTQKNHSIAAIVNPATPREAAITTDGVVTIYSYVASASHKVSTSWITNDAWPSSLPGSAA